MFGALLTGLLKAFDCICHNLLFAKSNTYGLSLSDLKWYKIAIKIEDKKTNLGHFTVFDTVFSTNLQIGENYSVIFC